MMDSKRIMANSRLEKATMQASARMTTVRSDCDHVHAPLLGLSRSLPFAFPSLCSATRTTDAILYSYIGLVLQAMQVRVQAQARPARSDVRRPCTYMCTSQLAPRHPVRMWLWSNGCGRSRGIPWCALIGVQGPASLVPSRTLLFSSTARVQLSVAVVVTD